MPLMIFSDILSNEQIPNYRVIIYLRHSLARQHDYYYLSHLTLRQPFHYIKYMIPKDRKINALKTEELNMMKCLSKWVTCRDSP